MISLSCDDACASDVRLATLARRYRIPLVFYWSVDWHTMARAKGFEPLNYYDSLTLASEFEIGSHTITHAILTDLDIEDARYEIANSQVMLQDRYSVPVNKFCPPRGYINDKLMEIVNAYYTSCRLTRGKDLVHIHPDSGANGNRYWRDAISYLTTELWCHSWELDRYNMWQDLEDFLREVNNS